MIEVLKTVAMLCAVQFGGNGNGHLEFHIQNAQSVCQENLMKCVEETKDNSSPENMLAHCVSKSVYEACPKGGCAPSESISKYKLGKKVK